MIIAPVYRHLHQLICKIFLFQTKAERVHEELQLVVDYMSNVMQPLLSSSFVVLPVSTIENLETYV